MQKTSRFYRIFTRPKRLDPPSASPKNSRHSKGFSASRLTLIGIGGIVGAGFFLASGMPIVQAGPAILVSYLIGALLMSQVLGGITSVSMNHEVKGSFRVYAEQLLGSYIGFLQGWIFFVSGILAVTSEAVAMSIFTKLWLPHIPLSILATFYVLIVIALNAFGSENFGRIEALMSIVKIAALVGFVLTGVLLIIGVINADHDVNYTFMTQGKGFLPNGWLGVGKSMLIVIFSYSGIGLIANAVSEVKEPKITIPRATSGLIIWVTTLYILATACLLLMIPWNHVSTSQSPFVEALNRVHLYFVGSLLNAVILISAFSVMAGALFSNMIMLRSLAESKKAPRFLLRQSSRGTPWGSLIFCTVSLFAALSLAYVLPSKVYNYLTSASAFFTFLNWSIMMLTFIRWYKCSYKRGDTLSKWLLFRPYGQWITLFLIAVLAVFSLFSADQRVGFYYAAGFWAAITIGYGWLKKRNRQGS